MTGQTMLNIAQRAFNTPLMLDPTKASVIARAFGPRMLGLAAGADVEIKGDAGAVSNAHNQPHAASLVGDELHIQLQKHGGGFSIIQGVAVITVTGTLVRRGSWVGESSGSTSYEGLSAQIRAAVGDPNVRAIALEIDSFGGEAAGIFDLAEQIRAARAVKPVHAFVADYALSAGYAIASQADWITVPPFGEAGSIGVVSMHVDFEDKLANEGVRVTLIHSGEKKVEGNPFEHLPEDVRSRIQKDNDAMRLRFAQDVVVGRKGRVTLESALLTEAGVYRGDAAVKAGLADEVSEARAAFEAFVVSVNETDGRGPDRAPEFSGSSGCSTGAEAPQTKETDMKDDVIAPDAETPKAKEANPVTESSTANVANAPDATAAERDRASKITGRVAEAGLPPSMAQQMIADGTPVTAALEKILDAKAESGADGGDIRSAARVTGDGRDRTREGMTKALLDKAGLDGGERNEFTGMTLRELARASLTAQGIAIPVGGSMAMAGAAFAPAMAGGMHSVSDFTNILADVANKSMLKGFEEAPETFPMFTSAGIMSDFKPHKRVGLDSFPSLKEVAEGAEFEYGSMGEHGEVAVLATYGQLFSITRQTIINDDLSAFTTVPQRMGRAAKRTVGDLVFAVLSSNPVMADGTALFHADHGNLAASGAGPSEATINAAITAMAMQTDGSGEAKLNISPKYLLAGPSSRSAVLQSLNSASAPDDTAKAGTAKMSGAYNTVKDAAEPIFDARIAGAAWYMLADPNQFDGLEVGYLDGIDTPFMEQQEGWTVDGTDFKVRIDAAATATAYQTLFMNAGS